MPKIREDHYLLNLIPIPGTIVSVNNYLLTLVLKPELSEKERESVLSDVKKKVTGENGKITKEDLWGVRDLAYPIRKQSKGYYAHFEVETDPSVVKSLDKVLKVEEDILRFLLTKAEVKKSKVKTKTSKEEKKD